MWSVFLSVRPMSSSILPEVFQLKHDLVEKSIAFRVFFRKVKTLFDVDLPFVVASRPENGELQVLGNVVYVVGEIVLGILSLQSVGGKID